MTALCEVCGASYPSLRAVRGHQNIRGSRCRLTPEQRHAVLLETQRRYTSKPEARENKNAWQRQARKEKREAYNGYQRKVRATDKGRARIRLTNALLAGQIVRQPCQECGDPKSHGHHHRGYAPEFALDVIWLCLRHHQEAHRVAA